jgi:hypothetical protein
VASTRTAQRLTIETLRGSKNTLRQRKEHTLVKGKRVNEIKYVSEKVYVKRACKRKELYMSESNKCRRNRGFIEAHYFDKTFFIAALYKRQTC